MQLTLIEAEHLLSKIFCQEIGTKVTIVNSAGIMISPVSFGKVMQMLANEPRFKIEAIKLYREVNTNVGLAEAKMYVESLARIP